MRRSWAAVVLLFFLFQWSDITVFYSDAGFFPWSAAKSVVRADFHYTLFSFITSPIAVYCVYLFFLATLISMIAGFFPRIATILSVLILFSFDERNAFVLGGGDTLLRSIGFILVLWTITSFISHSATTHHHSRLMPVWPRRLLLWQMIILYGTSFWYKLLGTLWVQGSAVEVALHHPLFVRWPMSVMNLVTPLAPAIDYGSLIWEGLWILLLVPRWLTDLLPAQFPRIPLKRILMGIGIVFHAGIFILMDAGSFSLVVFVAYCGLLEKEDFQWIQKMKGKMYWKLPGK